MLPILKQLEIKCLKGYKPLPPPTVDDLNAYEVKAKFKLPKSFREYALHFGAGTLASCYIVRVPGYPELPNCNLFEFNRYCHETDVEKTRKFSQSKLLKRLIYFCSTNESDEIAWDPSDVTNAAARDYGIYGVLRYGDEIVRLASSFEEFLNSAFTNLAEKMGFGDTGYDPPKVFHHNAIKRSR